MSKYDFEYQNTIFRLSSNVKIEFRISKYDFPTLFEYRKTKSEKRKTKSEKRKMKSEKRKSNQLHLTKVVLFLLFYHISRTRTAYRFAPCSTRLLYLYFIWNLKNTLWKQLSGYDVGLRIGRSWVQAPSPTIFFAVPHTYIYLYINYNIHNIFSILIFHK